MPTANSNENNPHPTTMSKLEIETQTFGEEALFPTRTVQIGSKTIETPAKAIPIEETRPHEQVAPETRGVNELYKEVGGKKLRKERRGKASPIGKPLRRGANKAEDGEMTFAFLSYQESSTLPEADAATMVKLLAEHSDVLVAPLLPEIAGSASSDSGLGDPAYGSYKESVLRFLEQANRVAPDLPVMGTLPPLEWQFIDDLLNEYTTRGIRAYAANFDRTRITANRQVERVKPLVQYPVRRGIEESVLLYAINLHSGQRDDSLGARPAADITPFSMGFDIVGGNHISPSLPSKVFEEMESENDSLVFHLLDKENYTYQDVPLDQLPARFPADSTFDADHIVQRVRKSPKNAKYRLQRLVNAEQMAFAIDELQDEIDEGSAFEHIASKAGVSNAVLSSLQDVRDGFDDERDQTGLSDF